MEYEDRDRQAQRPKYDFYLFDLETLYPPNTGLEKARLQNSKDYLVEKLGIDRSKIDGLDTNRLLWNNGTTMAGLRAFECDFISDEYNSFVYGRLPYENLKPDPSLRDILLSLPSGKVVIFTTANKDHAVKVLSRLGLDDCYDEIVSFEAFNPIHKKITVTEDEDEFESISNPTKSSSSKNGSPILDSMGHFVKLNAYTSVLPKPSVICKPSEHAIELALKIANLNPQRTLFFEDCVRTIQAGKRLGLHTVQVGASQRAKGADYALESIHNLREAIPELWETDLKSEVAYRGKLASYENSSKCSLRRSEMIPYYY